MSRRSAVLQDYGGSFVPMDFQTAMEANQLAEQRRQHDNQMKMHEADQKKKDAGDATDYITGLKVPHIGDNTVDLYNDAQMKAVQDKLVGMAKKGASVNEIKMAAMPELQKISQGYTIAKSEYEKVANGVKDLSKDYPTGDTEAARSIAGKEMLNNIFNFDDKGNNLGYKDPSLIAPDKNYMQSLTTNENLPKWYRESGSFESGIKKLPLIPVGGKTSYTDKYGKKVMQSYTGHGSVFDEPVINDAGEQTGWRLKSEAVPLGRNPDGSLIVEQVMPKEQLSLVLDTPAANLDFQYKFNKQLEESGVNPDKLDPRAKDILQRKFAYDLFDKTGIHGSSFLTVDEKKEAPVRHITNNNIRVGGGEDAKINNLYGRIGEKIEGDISKGFGATRFSSLGNDEQAVVKQTVENAGYTLEEGGGNVYLAKDGNEYKIYKAEGGKLLPKDKENEIATFSFIGTNLPKQPNAKAKVEVVRQAQSGAPATKSTSSKTFNVVDPNTGKVIMKGVDEASANKAKAKGYKVQ